MLQLPRGSQCRLTVIYGPPRRKLPSCLRVGTELAALEGFIQQVNLRRSREYDDDPELVEPVIVEDVQDLIPLMSLRVLKDERRAFEEQGYVVRRVIASASIPPAGPSASETGTREASGPTELKWHRWTFLTTGGRSRLARRREGIINGEPGRRHEAVRRN